MTRRATVCYIAWIATALAVSRGSAAWSQERNSKVKLHVSVDGDTFLVGETILLKIELENTTGALQDFPDPEDLRNSQFSYIVSGPNSPNGIPFKSKIALPDPNSPALIKVAPHEKLLSQLALDKMFALTMPGKYTLRARFEWRGQVEQFPPAAFTIEGGGLISARIMADDGFQTPVLQRILALAGSPPRLYQMMFRQTRLSIGEIGFIEMIRAAVPEPDAREAIEPWTNFDRTALDFSRFGWASSNAAVLESGEPAERVRVSLAPGARVIHPALMHESGLAELFVLEGSANSLTLLQFPHADEGKPAPAGKTIWSVKLPFPSANSYIRASMAPRPKGTPYALIASAADAAIVDISLFDGSRNGNRRSTEIKNARLLPDSEPDLWVDAKGVPHAALLFAEESPDHRIFLAELAWSNGNPTVQRHPTISLARPVRASAVTHSVAPGGSPGPSWFVLLDDGSYVDSFHPEAAPRSTVRRPLMPIQLMALGPAVYLAVNNGVPLIGFELLH